MKVNILRILPKVPFFFIILQFLFHFLSCVYYASFILRVCAFASQCYMFSNFHPFTFSLFCHSWIGYLQIKNVFLNKDLCRDLCWSYKEYVLFFSSSKYNFYTIMNLFTQFVSPDDIHAIEGKTNVVLYGEIGCIALSIPPNFCCARQIQNNYYSILPASLISIY